MLKPTEHSLHLGLLSQSVAEPTKFIQHSKSSFPLHMRKENEPISENCAFKEKRQEVISVFSTLQSAGNKW
jgi:hypothetical protein